MEKKVKSKNRVPFILINKKHDKKINRVIWWIVGVVASLLAVIVVVGEISDRIGISSLRSHIEESNKMLEAFEASMDGNSQGQYENELNENAWDYYSDGSLEHFSSSRSIIIYEYENPELSDDVIAELGKYTGLEKIILNGARCRYCEIPWDYRDPDSKLPNLSQLKSVAKYLNVLAKYYLENGENPKALEVLHAGFIMSSDLSKGIPALVAEMIKTACDTILLNAVEYGLSKDYFNSQELAEISAMLIIEPEKDIADMVYWDILQMLYLFAGNTNIGSDADPVDTSNTSPGYFTKRVIHLKSWFSLYLGMAKTYDLMAELNEKVKGRKWNEIYKETDEYQSKIEKTSLWGYLMPVFDFVYFKYLATEQRMKLVKVAALLAKYEKDNDEYPDSLEELGLDENLLKDKLSGSKLIYKIKEDNSVMIGVDIHKINIPQRNPYKKYVDYFEPIVLD
ncbi:hypothetical protein KAU32_06910 [bacterium]|nr:hypothetical protein [bacterium]